MRMRCAFCQHAAAGRRRVGLLAAMRGLLSGRRLLPACGAHFINCTTPAMYASPPCRAMGWMIYAEIDSVISSFIIYSIVASRPYAMPPARLYCGARHVVSARSTARVLIEPRLRTRSGNAACRAMPSDVAIGNETTPAPIAGHR